MFPKHINQNNKLEQSKPPQIDNKPKKTRVTKDPSYLMLRLTFIDYFKIVSCV